MLPAVRRVVLISLDGFASFYWTDPGVRMPALRRLAERGVVARRMECVFPSTTWPTHASMVTGVRPDRHGVVGNYVLNRQSRRAEDLTGDPIYDADRPARRAAKSTSGRRDAAATTVTGPIIPTTARSSWRPASASGGPPSSARSRAATSRRRWRTCSGSSSVTSRASSSWARSSEGVEDLRPSAAAAQEE